MRTRRYAAGPRRRTASTTAPDGDAAIGAGLSDDRTLGALGSFGHDDLVGPKQHASAAALAVTIWRRGVRHVARGRQGIGATPVNDDVEGVLPAEGDRQELEELAITARDHNQVIRHHP